MKRRAHRYCIDCNDEIQPRYVRCTVCSRKRTVDLERIAIEDEAIAATVAGPERVTTGWDELFQGLAILTQRIREFTNGK